MKNQLLRIFPVLLALFALSACGSATPSNGIPANAAQIHVAYAASLQPWMDKAVGAFNQSGAKNANGNPIYVIAEPLGSGAIVEAMVQAATPYDLVIPSDKLWMDMLAARRASNNEPTLNVGSCTIVARSPIVMVTWKPMAQALGWPEREFTWNDISELALSPSAWQGYDHPEWGALTYGHAHPILSDGGLGALLGEAYAAAPLTTSDVQSDVVKSYVRVVERSVARYGSDSSSLIAAMAQKGQRFLHVAIGYEADVVANSTGSDDSLLAIYPNETFMANFTACPVGTNAADAGQFAQFLTSGTMQSAALAAGLRPAGTTPALGAPIDRSHGVDSSVNFKELALPSADVIRSLQQMWSELKRPLNVTLVVDISGSMNDEGKIAAAREGAKAFVNRLSDEDVLSLYTFNADYRLLISQANVGQQRSNILNMIGGLTADGGTALYDTVFAARRAMKLDSGHIFAMVVLSDGQDTSSRLNGLDYLVDTIGNSKGNVILYTIGYGSSADQTTLNRIANAGNGLFFTGDPGNIDQVYLEIASQVGGSRGLGR